MDDLSYELVFTPIMDNVISYFRYSKIQIVKSCYFVKSIKYIHVLSKLQIRMQKNVSCSPLPPLLIPISFQLNECKPLVFQTWII